MLIEDIVVNFNAPAEAYSDEAGDSPNAYNVDDLAWFPSVAQKESGLYFGPDAFWDPYALGFCRCTTASTARRRRWCLMI